MSREKSEREMRKWTSVIRARRTPPLRKRHKKRKIMDMCPRVSRAHFSEIISERVIMDACPRVSRTQLHKIIGYLVLEKMGKDRRF
jgi:hypothetical protein